MAQRIGEVEVIQMAEYFVVANSFAAPMVSDMSTQYVQGTTPKGALLDFVQTYDHPCGLFAANIYRNADDYHKNEKPLETFRSEKARRDK